MNESRCRSCSKKGRLLTGTVNQRRSACSSVMRLGERRFKAPQIIGGGRTRGLGAIQRNDAFLHRADVRRKGAAGYA